MCGTDTKTLPSFRLRLDLRLDLDLNLPELTRLKWVTTLPVPPLFPSRQWKVVSVSPGGPSSMRLTQRGSVGIPGFPWVHTATLG